MPNFGSQDMEDFQKGFFWGVQSSEQHFVSFSLDFQNQMLDFFCLVP
jgi:hypothetical protein